MRLVMISSPKLTASLSLIMQLSVVLGGIVLLGIVLAVRTRYRRGLKQLPGPFLASISPLDRIITAVSGQQFRRHLEYHERYGPLVRVGPNQVSFSNSDLIPHVYGITSRFLKVRPVTHKRIDWLGFLTHHRSRAISTRCST